MSEPSHQDDPERQDSGDLDGRDQETARPTPASRAQKRSRRSVWLILAAVVVAAILVVLVIALSPRMMPQMAARAGMGSFDYQVQVYSQDTQERVRGARVTIDIRGELPLQGVTGADGAARVRIPSEYAARQGVLRVESTEYRLFRQHIDLVADRLPNAILLERTAAQAAPTLAALSAPMSTASATFTPTSTPSPTALPTGTPLPTMTSTPVSIEIAVATQRASIHERPDDRSTALGEVLPRQSVAVLGRSEEGNWLYVRSGDDTDGYADRDAFDWPGELAALPVISSSPPPTGAGPGATTPVPASAGRIAFFCDRDGDAEIVVMNEDGTDLRQVTHNAVGDRHPSWSPDGRQIVFTRDGHSRYADIYVVNADGNGERPLFQDGTNAIDMWPAWSPTGEWIAFQSNRSGQYDIYLIRPDGTEERPLVTGQGNDEMPAWTPDGQRVVFHSDRSGIYQIYSVDLSGGTEQHPIPSGDNYWGPDVSPADGRLAAYSNRSGTYEIFIEVDDRPYRITNTTTEERMPAWSPDGQSIAFTSNRDGSFDIYSVRLADALSVGSDAQWTKLTNLPGNCEDPAWWGP